MKKHVYRVGDIVEIGEGVFPVRRVGYPLHFSEITDEQLKACETCGPLFKLADALYFGPRPEARVRCDLLDAIRKVYVVKHGFGGKERTLLYSDQGLAPGRYRVVSKRCAKTGTRVPPRFDYNVYEQDNGYLRNEQTHVLLSVVEERRTCEDFALVVEASKVKPVLEEVSK